MFYDLAFIYNIPELACSFNVKRWPFHLNIVISYLSPVSSAPQCKSICRLRQFLVELIRAFPSVSTEFGLSDGYPLCSDLVD